MGIGDRIVHGIIVIVFLCSLLIALAFGFNRDFELAGVYFVVSSIVCFVSGVILVKTG
jgi:hypothetical protein